MKRFSLNKALTCVVALLTAAAIMFSACDEEKLPGNLILTVPDTSYSAPDALGVYLADAPLCVNAHPRMIVTTDIGGSDPDDVQSLVHLLVSLDRVELEGIISQHAWVPYGTGATDLINKLISGYEAVLPNLRKHSAEFPSADYLRSIVKVGQPEAAMAGVGDGKDSDGSEWIIKIVDKEDERPVWIAAWSGMNTLAQALWKVQKTRNKEQVDRFVRKIRVYDVLGQDEAGAWITKNFPRLTYIRNKQIYGWPPSDEWVKKNVQNIGSFGALYPDRRWATEGDSPSFMYCLDNGLNCPEHPEYGGWGGRFDTQREANIRGMDWVKRTGLDEPRFDPYYMLPSAREGAEAIIKWQSAIFNDFAARMLWTVSDSYSKANHHPVGVIDDDSTLNVVSKQAVCGKTLILDARKSSDPDGNGLSFKWIFYKEPSSYKEDLQLDTSEKGVCKITIPENAAGKTIHIILELTDDGSPALTAYRRVIVSPTNVQGNEHVF